MRKLNIFFITTVFCFAGVTGNAFGRHYEGAHSGNSSSSSGGAGSPSAPSLAAGCAAAVASTDLNLNNVRTFILTGGDFWNNRNTRDPGYEIPKGSRKHSIYAGALWMGGVDVNGQLKLAAQQFRSRGNDFWPGPLNTKTVDIDSESCKKYDKHFVTYRKDVEKFNRWFELSQENPAALALDPEFAGYTIPKIILEWPAHGDPAKFEGYYLAPFYDRNGDGEYNPFDGDYPGYELVKKDNNCRVSREVSLYGDMNLWWVFNDKGNIHTETGGAPIGMEIRGQAFAFSTNDDINNMTFYNYELVNRSTFKLQNTYFGVWCDADLGFYDDDYVGCDVMRGLGYCYNGPAVDGSGAPGHYGANPPAVGIDFFEGPYQDTDGEDNVGPYDPLLAPFGIKDIRYNNEWILNFQTAKAGKGIPYLGIGIGYGDGIPDNERFGMSRFLYHNKGSGGPTTDPTTATDYYNYLRGIWKDNTPMRYGGNGHFNGGGTGDQCNYMFPGASATGGHTDPIGWGLPSGHALGSASDWSEESVGNLPFDRRFAQSAGPFTLEPGAKNNITVGVVWARALSGGPVASVRKLKSVDDMAQSLFDNCFRITNGPDAPDVAVKELDREIILLLSNKRGSNNFNQAYTEIDPRIPAFDADGKLNDRTYKFQGYLIYQVKDNTVGPNELGNPDRARLVAQCDIKDSVIDIINYRMDEDLGVEIPEPVIIRGNNKGIEHSFRFTEDRFAQGDRQLVNHKSYYYIAIAYGFNQFKKFDPADPFALDGQKRPYILSRKARTGSIRAYKATPHNPIPLNLGTKVNAQFGDMPMITRLEGQGNGGLNIEFTTETENALFAANSKHVISNPQYKKNRGPVNVKVVDPLSVPMGEFELAFNSSVNAANIDNARWTLTNLNPININGTDYPVGKFIVKSDTVISVRNEQIIPELGLSILIDQVKFPGDDVRGGNGLITSSIEFSDPSKVWLTGVNDADGELPHNWIRSGSYENTNTGGDRSYDDVKDAAGRWKDPAENYEAVVNGTWAPYGLTAFRRHGPAFNFESVRRARLRDLKSVDVVITSDKSKWTRCPVIENSHDPALAVGGAQKNYLRRSPSVDKDGKIDTVSAVSTNPNHPNYISKTGMGWFPGYAVCLETGERLNMAFSEDSWMGADNGRDMLWNPTSSMFATGNDSLDKLARFGGKHYIYVFDNGATHSPATDLPAYDEARTLMKYFTSATLTDMRIAWTSCMWVGFPLSIKDTKFMSSDVRIKLRVERPYQKFASTTPKNDSVPLYTFNLNDLAVEFGNQSKKDTILSMLNVVPNPYYAYSGYEINQIDNRVKFINLPEVCTITIYTVNGTLIRQYTKANPMTSLDWDLKNQVGIPISGGVYLIHVKVPDVGERVLKWFGIMRPIDLDSF
jgi:hypothetical protein